MKRFVCWVTLSLVLAGSATALQWGVKVGGGSLFKPSPSRWGGLASIEIPLSEEYPTSLSAFFEMYKKSGFTTIPAGLSILYKAPLSRYGGTIYFTGGGGILRLSGPDILTGADRSSTDGIITVAGGTYVPVTESISVFGQFRWFKRFASGAVNEYGVQFGLHFPLGRD